MGACGLGGTLLVAGCTGDEDDAPGPRRRRESRGTDPDITVATEAHAAVRAALDLVETTLERHPALADQLAALRTAHQEHLAVLDDAVPEDALAASPTNAPAQPGGLQAPEGSPGTDASAGSRPGRVPRVPAQAVVRVVESEAATVVQLKRLAFRARSGPFARLLGSIAASAAQHAASLAGSAGGP